jgi:hypothetical protein
MFSGTGTVSEFKFNFSHSCCSNDHQVEPDPSVAIDQRKQNINAAVTAHIQLVSHNTNIDRIAKQLFVKQSTSNIEPTNSNEIETLQITPNYSLQKRIFYGEKTELKDIIKQSDIVSKVYEGGFKVMKRQTKIYQQQIFLIQL